MAFKINIGTKEGKTYKLETESSSLIGKELGQKISGKDLGVDKPELEDYEFQIKGASDKSGFTAMENIEGQGTKRVLLSYEKGMKKRPKHEGKKKHSNETPKGLRLRKTVRGKVISEDIRQVNLTVTKQGKKPLKDIFEPKTEEKPEETKEEKK